MSSNTILNRVQEYIFRINIPIDSFGNQHLSHGYFEYPETLFTIYRTSINIQSNSTLEEICEEIKELFYDLDRHMRRIHYLNSRVGKINKLFKNPFKRNIATRIYPEELEDSSELFYYKSHRLIKLLERLPGIGKIKNCNVRIVRNLLIDHPHKEGGSLTQSFACGGTNGPIIRPRVFISGRPGNPDLDPGLFINAKEFFDTISMALEGWIITNSYIARATISSSTFENGPKRELLSTVTKLIHKSSKK